MRLLRLVGDPPPSPSPPLELFSMRASMAVSQKSLLPHSPSQHRQHMPYAPLLNINLIGNFLGFGFGLFLLLVVAFPSFPSFFFQLPTISNSYHFRTLR